MIFHSDKGEWDSLQELRAWYLTNPGCGGEAHNLDPGPFGQDDWQPDLLHASEIGGCPRASMYRLSHEDEKPRSESSKANRAIMFWSGYRLHYLTYSALNAAGLLVSHEQAVPLPDGWTGRLDALIQTASDSLPILYDCKTVLPNALKYSYDMPKDKDCLQLGVYAYALNHTSDGVKEGIIEYVDRAGSNSPLECYPIDLTNWRGEAQVAMAALEKARDELPYLPEILPPVYVGSYWKRRGENYRDLKTISYQPDWRCSYCDYHLHLKDTGTHSESSCKPFFEKPEEVASFKRGSLVSVKHGHEDAVAAWLQSHVTSYVIEEEDD
jgi:hypothetical protein